MKRCSGTSLMPPEMGRMQRFVAALLARDGALVEAIEPEGLEVLAPPPCSRRWGCPNCAGSGSASRCPRARSGSASRPTGSTGSAACWATEAAGSGSCCGLTSGLPRIPNGFWRMSWCWITQPSGCWTWRPPGPAIWCWTFRFAAVSDEKREGVLRLALTRRPARCRTPCSSRSRPGWTTEEAANAALPDGTSCRRLGIAPRARSGREALPSRLEAALAPFVMGLRRRLSRDQDRLHAYHDELHRESMRRLFALPRMIRRAGARSSGSRRSDANTAPRSMTWPASMRCGSRSTGCRRWSW